ncbi:hypothetical protein PF004_g5539 [Phytophthora fragariae]|uniref:Integrase catalytic domain-containing protein n=2 Tax=Phytophthora fragariae TaxID=53985 RepID=A0A6G0PF98_9STRA|nr:hypothetical protein PF004_g5539 [Phytophthora fragariae]
MELSSLQFKVHHRSGTSMGHVDGLSRLPMDSVNALTIADILNFAPMMTGLLNPEPSSEVPSSVGECDRTARDGEDAESKENEPRDLWGDFDFDDDEVLKLKLENGPSEEVDDASPQPTPPSHVDLFGLDSEQFMEKQQKVSWIKVLIALLEDGVLPLDPFMRRRVVSMAPKHLVVNGLLMRTVHLPANVGPARMVTVPVVSIPYVETVLHFCHRDLLSSHLGWTKTIEKVRRYAYWPGWRKDVAEFVRECAKCGGGKGPRPWTSGRMQRMPVADLTGPFSLPVVDAVGPLPEIERGNRYILVFVDYFTRWAEAFANYTSEVAKAFYQTLGIRKLFGAAYHPEMQGLVERFDGTLIEMLRMHVDEAQTDWDVYLPKVMFVYRTVYSEALGDSPFFSLYGRDPVLTLDVVFINLGKRWKCNEVAQYRRELYRSMKDSRHLVERRLIKAQDRHEQRLRD